MSSDATGEIFVIVRNDGGSVDQASPTSGLPTSTGAAPPGQTTGAAVSGFGVPKFRNIAAMMAFAMVLPLA